MFKKITALVFICALLSATAFGAKLIDRNEAVDKALKRADGKVTKVKLDDDDGRLYYEVKVIDKAGDSHKMMVNAFDGSIAGYYKDSVPKDTAATLNRAVIDYKKAEKAAMDKQKNTRVIDTDLSARRNGPVYEITLLDEDGIVYDSEVNAVDGSVLMMKRHTDVRGTPAVSAKDAEKAALKAVKGEVIYTKLGSDDGKLIYEIDSVSDEGVLYEIKVDAATGNVLKAKVND